MKQKWLWFAWFALVAFVLIWNFSPLAVSQNGEKPVKGSDSYKPEIKPEMVDFIKVIQDAKQKVFPLIVYLKSIQEDYSGGKKSRYQIFGSGVIISPDGYVVTNNHVAEKSVDLKAVLLDEREVQCEIVGLDPDTDVALLKLDLSEEELPINYARFGNSDALKEGDFVMTMGSPLGLTRSISFGIASNTKRYLEGSSKYNLWIQTDAAINPGNSGGPLVNMNGEVIGINTLGAQWAQNIGFAIPSNIVKEVTDRLKIEKEYKRTWTGLVFQPLKDFTRSTYFDAENGVLVGSIDKGSPAYMAEVKAGDLIVSCNGEELNGTFIEDLPAIRRYFANLAPNIEIDLLVVRDKKEMHIKLQTKLKGAVEGEDFDCEEWGITIKEINQFRDAQLYYFVKEGVFIQGINYPGNAASSGLRHGDIIKSIEGIDIVTLDDVKKAYEKLNKLEKGKREILFKVYRTGIENYVVLDFNKLKADYEEEE